MFQSRWGFHPCDYSTYRKLKFLHHAYLKSVRLAHVWQRWRRKDPHNRVMRRRIRNDKGQTIGYEPPVPIPEPQMCPVFSRKVPERRHVNKKGQFFRDGFLEEKVVTDDFGIVADYAAARKPAKEKAEVQPLRMPLETIDALYEQARKWLENRA
jgi:hypothetical protein